MLSEPNKLINKNFLIKAIFIQIIMIALFLILNFLTVVAPKGSYIQHLKIAFNHGWLKPINAAGFDGVRGDAQYEDCQILEQGLNLSNVFLQNVLNAPKFGDATKCKSLETVLFSMDNANKEGISYYKMIQNISEKHINDYGFPEPYVQYLHGARTFAVGFISLFSLHYVRFFYQHIDYFLIFIISLIVTLSENLERTKRIAFAITFFTIFSFFHGIDFFGMHMEHGLGDILGFLTLLFMLHFLKKKQTDRLLLILLISGGFTAYIEKLVGIIPAILCLITIGVTLYYTASDLTKKNTLKILISSLVIFCIGFLFTYTAFIAIKLIFTSNLSPGFGAMPSVETTWSYLIKAFLHRAYSQVGDHAITYPMVIKMLWSRTYWLGGSTYIVKPVFILSVAGMLVIGSLNFLMPRFIDFQKRYSFFFLLSLIPYSIVFGWYFIFKNHSMVHPFFMVRIISYSLFSGWFFIISFFSDLWESKNKKMILSIIILLILIIFISDIFIQYSETGFY